MTKNKLKIKKNDKVIILAGKDKGKKGDVIKVFPKEMKVLVSGINKAKKSVRPTQYNPQGGIIDIEKPIHYSNVALVDPKTESATRIGYKILDDGKKVRYSKKSKEIFDNA
jgi:large subunit ribosomal protein L24